MQQGCVLVNWDESSAPKALLEAKSAEEAMRLMNEAFPLLVGEEGGEGGGGDPRRRTTVYGAAALCGVFPRRI